MRILVVDGHPGNREFTRAQLEGIGHHIFLANNGVEALLLLEHEPIDAILSDILMPRMNGCRLCGEVRRAARFRDIRFVIYTSTRLSAADETVALDLGASKCVRKPAPTRVLLEALEDSAAASRRPPKRHLRRPH
jgi:CheY-like chemotaxis protein